VGVSSVSSVSSVSREIASAVLMMVVFVLVLVLVIMWVEKEVIGAYRLFVVCRQTIYIHIYSIVVSELSEQ
jgi:hypothetical protein